jgi:hypothetical protein
MAVVLDLMGQAVGEDRWVSTGDDPMEIKMNLATLIHNQKGTPTIGHFGSRDKTSIMLSKGKFRE